MAWIQDNLMMLIAFAAVAWLVWGKIVKPKLAGVQKMSAQAIQSMNSNAYTLVDVRSKAEWNGGKAANAIHIPMSEIKQRMHEVPKDKPVVCICASGMRSLSAAATLGQAGYKPVYNFSGGMGSWVAAKLPTKR